MDFDRVFLCLFFSKGRKIFYAVGGGKNKYVSKKKKDRKKKPKKTQWLIVNIPTVEKSMSGQHWACYWQAAFIKMQAERDRK